MREILESFDKKTEDSEPIQKAQTLSRRQLPKRFYSRAFVEKNDKGFSILLDGKLVKSPAKRDLIVPNENLAKMLADEFNMQDTYIDPATMPITRLVNTVIDGIMDDMQPVFEDFLRIAANDMLFYRASSPKELVDRQRKAFDPIIDFAEKTMGTRFMLTEGVMHIEQSQQAIMALSHYMRQIECPYSLAALHVMTTLSGSALLALAVLKAEIDINQAWKIANLDEDWTIEHWGEDFEAKERRAYKKLEFDAAAAILAAFEVKEKK